MEKLIDYKSFKKSEISFESRFNVERISGKDIAIIGMSGRFASADTVSDFWKGLRQGKDYIGDVPQNRKEDIEAYIMGSQKLRVYNGEYKYFKGAFLNDIDCFDCEMFNISPREAELMDPNQRLLLEIMWEATEDAGYGRGLKGSRTGVYIGFSSDFGVDYKNYCLLVSGSNDDSDEIGNIRSIIGSRISYILDLKGPAVMIDTACSSALVAVHTACRAIRNGECETAIAGSVKVFLAPVREKDGKGDITIASSSGKARTFDDSSDGTGFGEGVGAVLLKPLRKAIEDGDHIHAVIKGSAVNQDGSSVGITAPNMAAQQDVIMRAWKDADIDPETITYIEAHGTGTKLGDPVEIAGIKKAFENYTQKKQFCAVSSVKTNVGHLDHAAGMVSLIKAVMSLKNAELPPSLHLLMPNRNIGFEESPVFINDRLSEWKTEGFPRRCGISSFGLSGTNCHIVLEEFRNTGAAVKTEALIKKKPYIFTLSARNVDSLKRLIDRYDNFLGKCIGHDIKNICYTANTGRGHYNHRIALIVEDLSDLREKIRFINNEGFDQLKEKAIFYGQHKLVSVSKKVKAEGEIDFEEIKLLNEQVYETIEKLSDVTETEERKLKLERLCSLYMRGADINWETLYISSKHKRVSLPVYPFLKERHWVRHYKENSNEDAIVKGNMIHPLIDTCLAQSMGIEIYSTIFNVKRHWVLNEHRVTGSYLIPGTTYIEMAAKVASARRTKRVIEMRDVIFLEPLAVDENNEKEVHTIVKEEEGYCEFTVVSKTETGAKWTRYMEGKLLFTDEMKPAEFDIDNIEGGFERVEEVTKYENVLEGVETGPRFKNARRVHIGSNEVLAYLELPEYYHKDLDEYYLHPALLDSAVNMCNGNIGEGLYLPLSYKRIKIFSGLPSAIYSYIIKRSSRKDNHEIASFDIVIMDVHSNVLVMIEDYTVKRVDQKEFATRERYDVLDYFEIGWRDKPVVDSVKEIKGQGFLVFKNSSGVALSIVKELRDSGREVIEVEEGCRYEKIEDSRYTVGCTGDDYMQLITELSGRFSSVIHMLSIDESRESSNVKELDRLLERGVYSLFHLTKALINFKAGDINLMLVTNHANKVISSDNRVYPHNAAFIGLGKVISQEYGSLGCRCIDIDDKLKLQNILDEMKIDDFLKYVAYREGKRYVPELREVDGNGLGTRELELRNDGVYIITGGMGGIGLEIAKYFSGRKKVNLCLISRTKFPERSSWDLILKENTDDGMCRKIRSLRNIEQKGSQVMIYNADISKNEQVQRVIFDIRERLGRINGVVHAAGVPGDGFIIRKDMDTFKEVILPKIIGTHILDELTCNDRLDFFAMFSSVTSLTGVPGQGDYSAANAYMDSYAHYAASQGKRTITINWPAWEEIGMAVDYNAVNRQSLFMPISTKAGIRSFELILRSSPVRILPAKLNYEMIDLYKGEIPFELSEHILSTLRGNSSGRNLHKPVEADDVSDIKVVLKGKVNKSYTRTEWELAKAWGIVLGVREVDIYDNFNELGGDSILAIRLLKEIQKRFGGIVDIADVFTYPTVGEMAEYIEKKQVKGNVFETIEEREEADAGLDDMLKKLADGEMSIEEAERLIDLGDEE